jgi:hypothetical protein
MGIARGYRDEINCGLSYSNYHLSSEIILNKNTSYTGLKMGYTYSSGFINLGLQAINYTNFIQNIFALRPELGLTLIGVYEIIYGYNVFLNDTKSININNNNISLRWTIGTFKD